MKQLIEQQREDFEKRFKIFEQVAHDEVDGTFAIEHDKEKVWNWHKQSLKQFIDGLIEETEKLIVNRPESLIKLNAHLDSRTQQHQYSRAVGYCEAVDKGVAHLKELKEELN